MNMVAFLISNAGSFLNEELGTYTALKTATRSLLYGIAFGPTATPKLASFCDTNTL